jgi:uncharacterized protein (DUF58 family)
MTDPRATDAQDSRPPATADHGADAALLAEVEHLFLTARVLARGALAGMHRSVRRGASIEFSEHKLYTPGDDIRHIDWRAFAKTDRYHVKQFEDETNLRVELLVDHSGSMAFATENRQTKLSYARSLAAALSYLALRQGDAAGLFTFSDRVTSEVPALASSSHLNEVLRRLAALQASGPTHIADSIDHFARTRRRQSVTILLTDLFDANPDLMHAFRRLAARHHDISVLHLLDPAEVRFPYENPTLFVSMEDTQRLFVHPRTLRAAYVAQMRRFLDNTARQMAEVGIHYHIVHTDERPERVLGAFLRRREARR